jgi:hypothetical protein
MAITAYAGNANARSSLLLAEGPHIRNAGHRKERAMIRFRLFGAAAYLAASIASPASAQPVVSEPGMEAFVHPNSDLGIGMSRPVVDSHAMMSVDARARARHVKMRVTPHR